MGSVTTVSLPAPAGTDLVKLTAGDGRHLVTDAGLATVLATIMAAGGPDGESLFR